MPFCHQSSLSFFIYFKRLTGLLFFSLLLIGCNPDNDSTQDKSAQDKSGVKKQSKQEPLKSNQSQKQDAETSFDLDEQKEAFALTKFEVLDISESEYDKTPSIAISFSVPLDSTVDYAKNIQVINDKNQTVTGSWILNQSRTRIYFTNIDARQKYEVRVNSNISSITNQQLTRNHSVKLTTNALEASVRFLNKGNILPAELTNGLAIESVNISELDVNFFRVSNDNISRVLRDGLSGYSYYLHDIPQYAELAYTARYSIDLVRNKTMTTNLPVHKVKQLSLPGLYIAVMKPAGTFPYDHQLTTFYISNLALQTRSFKQLIEVHALNISDGLPQANVELEVISQKGYVLVKGKTDKNGNFKTAKWDDDAAIIGRHQDNFAVLSFSSPALDLSEQLSVTRQQNEQELFLYGPRDLYRPGETININGLLRGVDGESVAAVPLEVKVIRPDNRIASEFSWFAKLDGFYQHELTFGRGEPTGEWLFKVKHPSGEEYEYSFSIEEFLPEKMKLSLTAQVNGLTAENFVDPKANISIKGQGDYLYGAPASGNRISANMKVQPSHFPFALKNFENEPELSALKDYYFGQDLQTSNSQYNGARQVDQSKLVELDDQKLDDSGLVEWLLPNLWQAEKFPTQVIFEASLFESGGRPVTRRQRQLIWPGDEQIGLRKLYKEAYADPYNNIEFEIINVDQKGQLKNIGQLEVNLIRENNRYFWRANGISNEGGWGYSQNNQNKRVYSRVLNSNDTRLTLNLPVEYGTYRIEIKDSSGQLKNSYRFFAGWSWDESGEVGVAGARPDKVRLLFDKDAYLENDVAKVNIISPHTGQALLRLESNKTLWEKQIYLNDLETEIEIPVSANWTRHDLYLSAMVISDTGQSKNNQSQNNQGDRQLPKRALGIEAFRLDRSNRELVVEIDAPELTQPEQKQAIKIKLISDLKNAAFVADSYVTLAAVDTGVLSLSNYQTPDPHDWFYGQRAYTVNIRDSFSHLIKNQEGELAVLKFGGDSELVRGGEQPNTDVQIVSLFSDVVKFDKNGEAIVDLDLPSFNGELRLMALVFSGDKFSHAEKKMIVRAPLVAEISKPRFLALKDKSQFAIDVQNLSGADQNLIGNLSIKGGLQQKEIKLSIKLKDGEKFSQIIEVVAENIGDGFIQFELFDEATDNKLPLVKKDWLLGVREAYPAEFKRYREVLHNGQSFQLKPEWVGQFQANSLQAKIEYSTVPPLSSDSHLQGLFQYPYGCLEQTSSRAWPLLNFSEKNQAGKLDEYAQKVIKDKNKHINAAIQRINGMQRSDGSFGLWSNQSKEVHWLTVYAMEFLINARQAGYSVPNDVMNKGLERLQYYIKSMNPSYSEREHYSDSPEHYGVAYRSYAAYVLATLNKTDLTQLRQLKDRVIKFSKSGLPTAHLAAAFELLGDSKTAKTLWEKATSYKSYPQFYSGDYGSQIRDSAWIMTLASDSKIAKGYQDLIYQINDELLTKRWFSTQERFALYQLALNLEKINGDDWTINLSQNNGLNEDEISGVKKFQQLLSSADFEQKQTAKLIEGDTLFVDLQIVGYPKQQPKAVANGIFSAKKYYDLQGQSIALTNIKSGDYVLVKIDVVSDQRMPDALLVDMLPAGFELENPGLEFALDYSELIIDGFAINQWLNKVRIEHQEYRDDRYVAALSLEQKNGISLFYLMRAVTAGSYQVPPTQVEDMYRPHLRSLSESIDPVTVLAR